LIRLDFRVLDGFVKSPIPALRALSQNFTHAKQSVFFEITQALTLNFLQNRKIVTLYECISSYRITIVLKPAAVIMQEVFCSTPERRCLSATTKISHYSFYPLIDQDYFG